ncbi:uncharacterized protein BDV14DRAFT_23762 [Aspergillus stella-maris]|uniref:uncharacterized protein n=1 Tax=Aspergillus stella-maris TaxID=1810926 RepID=UPI003CCDFA44
MNLEYMQPGGFFMNITTVPRLSQADNTNSRTSPPAPGDSEQSQGGATGYNSHAAATTDRPSKRRRGETQHPTERAMDNGVGSSESSRDLSSQPDTTKADAEQEPERWAAWQNDRQSSSILPAHQTMSPSALGNTEQGSRLPLHTEENIGATSNTPHGIYHGLFQDGNQLALEEPVQASLAASSTEAPTKPSSTSRPYNTMNPQTQRQGGAGRQCSSPTRVNTQLSPTTQQPLSQASLVNADDPTSYPGTQIPYSLGNRDQEYNYGPNWDHCYTNMGPNLLTDASFPAGNWDFEYNATSQPAQTGSSTPFLWGNWDHVYGHITPDFPTNTPFCAGNWDLEYNTASLPAQTATPAPYFYGNGEHGIEADPPSNIFPFAGNRNLNGDPGLRPMPEVSVPLVQSY